MGRRVRMLKRQPRAVYTVSDAAHHLQEPDFVHFDSRFPPRSAGVVGRLPDGSHHGGRVRLAAFALLGVVVVSVTLVAVLVSRRIGAPAPARSYASATRGSSLPRSQPPAPAGSSHPAPVAPAGSSYLGRTRPSSHSPRALRSRPPGGLNRAASSRPSAPHRLVTHRASVPRRTVESVAGVGSQRTVGTIGGASLQASEASVEAEQPAGNRCPCGAVAEFGFER